MSLGKRFLHGAGMSLMEHGVKTASVFLTTPLLNHVLGGDSYGYWLIVMAALGWFNLLDLNMSFTTMRYLSMAVGAKNEGRQATVLDVAARHFRRISLITAIGSPLVFMLLPFCYKRPEGDSVMTLLFATLPAGFSLSLRFLYRLPQIRLRAWVRYDLLALATIVRTLLFTGAVLWLLPRYPLLLVVSLASAGADVIELALQFLFARILPRVNAAPSDDPALRNDMMRFMWDMSLGSVGDGMRAYVGPFTVGWTAGMASVPVLSVGTRLVGILEDVVNALFGGGVLAVFGQIHGGEDQTRLRTEFERLSRITAGFGAWAVAGLALYSTAFIKRWMGPPFELSHLVVFIIAVPYALRFMQYAAHSLLYALGLQRQIMWVRCIGGLAAGVLAITFGYLWGVLGVATGCAIEMGVSYAIVIPIMVARCVGISPWRYFFCDVLGPGLKGALLPVLAAWATWSWAVPDYAMLVLCFAVYGLVFVISAPFTTLDAEGRAMLLRALRR